MQGKRHDPSCEDIILHIGVPRSPHALEEVQVNIVFGDLIELSPVRVWGRLSKEGGSRIPVERKAESEYANQVLNREKGHTFSDSEKSVASICSP